MKSNVFARLWTRLWDSFSGSMQATVGEKADARAIESQPADIREVVKEGRAGIDILEDYETEHRSADIVEVIEEGREGMDILDKIATEQEVSQGHRKEYAEAFMNLTRSLANAATIIGPDGVNIKVILFADSDFIFELLTEGQPAALEKAFKRLDMEQRASYARWLFGADLERVIKALNLLEAQE